MKPPDVTRPAHCGSSGEPRKVDADAKRIDDKIAGGLDGAQADFVDPLRATNVVPFRPRTATRQRADISIWPSPVDDGCWAVDITSPSGDASSVINYFRCFDDAVAAARQWAIELDADFDDPHVRGPAA